MQNVIGNKGELLHSVEWMEKRATLAIEVSMRDDASVHCEVRQLLFGSFASGRFVFAVSKSVIICGEKGRNSAH